MPCYELVVQLERAATRQPSVRAWLDTDLEAGLASEIELPLQRGEALEWSAVFVLAGRARFLYRIAVAADPGSIWAISIREHGARRRELFFDSDMMTLHKCWLLGTCWPQ